MTAPLIGLVMYAAAAMLLATAACGILLYAGRLTPPRAITGAVVFWLLAILPPIVGIVVDAVRSPVMCDTGECYDYTLWWMAIPIGWILASALLAVSILISRRSRQHGA